MSRVIISVLLISLVATPLGVLAQTPANQQSDDRVVSGTTEVIFDAVVKDKKGRPVKDLQAADFQITEDGVPQDVKSFRLIAGDVADAPKRQCEQTQQRPRKRRRAYWKLSTRPDWHVALVFDRLSVDSRTRAHDAALATWAPG